MSKAQTDNTYFYDKIAIRINHLPTKKNISVLDAYSGESKIWETIKKQSNKNINLVRIDVKTKKGLHLKGDNIKYLMAMDLSKFDAIDLDAYGVPYLQLKAIFQIAPATKKRRVVFITFNQTVFGQLPTSFLSELGYTKAMIKKCPTLFNSNGLEKMIHFLGINEVRKIYIRSKKRINYIAFNL